MRTLSALLLTCILAPAVTAQSLRHALVTRETPGASCAVPAAGETTPSFPVDTQRLYTWFLVDNTVPGDRYRVQWVSTDGTVFRTADFSPVRGGTYCFSASIEPSAAHPPLLPGLWSAVILRNGTFMRALYFTFTGVAARAPEVNASGIVEPWTYQRGTSPGGWTSIYGANLAQGTVSWRPSMNAPLPVSLGGVAVRIGGRPAPIAYVSPGVVNILAPGDLPTGTVPVLIERNGMQSQPVNVLVNRMLPSIYSIPDTARSPATFHVTAAVAGTSDLVGSRRVDPRVLRGARPGEFIDLYVTGLGPTLDGFPTGQMFSGAYRVAGPIRVELAGTAITPDFAGLISPGLYLVRIALPDSLPAGDLPIRIVSNDISSSEAVFLTIESGQPEVTLESVTLSPSTITAGESTSGTVTLTGPAPPEGAEVAVSVEQGNPAAIRIAPGARTGRFSYSTQAGSPARVLRFFARWKGVERSATLTVVAPQGGSALSDYEINVAATAVIEGRRVNVDLLLSIPNILPYAKVDTTADFLSGIALYVHYVNPVVSGNTATFAVSPSLSSYSNILAGIVHQPITAGRLVVHLSSASTGSPVTGTIQFQTASKNITADFTGTVRSSSRVK